MPGGLLAHSPPPVGGLVSYALAPPPLPPKIPCGGGGRGGPPKRREERSPNDRSPPGVGGNRRAFLGGLPTGAGGGGGGGHIHCDRSWRCGLYDTVPFPVPAPGALCTGSPGAGRDELEGKGPQKGAQQRLDRRLQGVAKAVGAGYCRLQMPLRLALAVRGTVAGHRLGALEGGGGGLYLTPLAMHAWGPRGAHPLLYVCPRVDPHTFAASNQPAGVEG